jgi:two-component system response regulator
MRNGQPPEQNSMMDKKRILLVDDNVDDIDLALRAFRKVGLPCDIQVAHDGIEAVELLLGKAAAPLPSVILLDLNLPRLRGLEVLREIRAHPRTRLIPVVILSSSREQTDLHASYVNGANSYICKPIDFDHFIAAVHSLGVYWLSLNEIPPEN